ncbi:hypothetical protein L1987_49690 [Smallanthus sonchifolius]|uniref:Uncharacterized protein n=1 Tax=Smallanthus sonchifolius TaxID=185202 RepID=A0ACB9FX19_9ASTR|nr:hypothetical protein L1987_49690 [Smallanthus sonchifolius]
MISLALCQFIPRLLFYMQRSCIVHTLEIFTLSWYQSRVLFCSAATVVFRLFLQSSLFSSIDLLLYSQYVENIRVTTVSKQKLPIPPANTSNRVDWDKLDGYFSNCRSVSFTSSPGMRNKTLEED